MAERSRLERLDEFLTKLGLLVAPIKDLVDEGAGAVPKVPYVRARFARDFQQYGNDLIAFGREDGIAFDRETALARRSVGNFNSVLDQVEGQMEPLRVRAKFDAILNGAMDAIRRIPADDPDTVLRSQSPFQTYVRLRAICTVAQRRVEIFDPYLDAPTFHRFLADIPTTVEIVVVTSEKVLGPGMTDRRARAQRDRIVAVSSLYAEERPQTYRLLATGKQHDRHLRVDDEVLHLGGSLKDAARNAPYTIASLDPTSSNHAFLDELLAAATEWYGPSVRVHRAQ